MEFSFPPGYFPAVANTASEAASPVVSPKGAGSSVVAEIPVVDPSPSSLRVPLVSDGVVVTLAKGTYLISPGGPVGKGGFHKVMVIFVENIP